MLSYKSFVLFYDFMIFSLMCPLKNVSIFIYKIEMQEKVENKIAGKGGGKNGKKWKNREKKKESREGKMISQKSKKRCL